MNSLRLGILQYSIIKFSCQVVSHIINSSTDTIPGWLKDFNRRNSWMIWISQESLCLLSLGSKSYIFWKPLFSLSPFGLLCWLFHELLNQWLWVPHNLLQIYVYYILYKDLHRHLISCWKESVNQRLLSLHQIYHLFNIKYMFEDQILHLSLWIVLIWTCYQDQSSNS